MKPIEITGPLAGYLGQMFGFRPVIAFGSVLSSIGIGLCVFSQNMQLVCFLWGVVYGFGCGMATAFIPQVVNLNFKKHASKANSITFAGVPVAGFILPPIVSILLKTYGLNGTFLILSSIALNSLPAAMLLKMPNKECSGDVESRTKLCRKTTVQQEANVKENNAGIIMNSSCTRDTDSSNKSTDTTIQDAFIGSGDSSHQQNDTLEKSVHGELISKQNSKSCLQKKKSNCAQTFSIFLDPVFILISIPRCFSVFFFLLLPTIIVDFSRDKNLTDTESLYVLMSVSCFDLIGKLGLGWITDTRYVAINKYNAIGFCIVAASLSFIVWSNGFTMLVVGVAAVSMCVGTTTPNFPGLVKQYMDKDKQTMAMASSFLLMVPLNFATTPLIGYFRDDIGSYDWLFYIMSIICLICACLLLLIPTVSGCRLKKQLPE